MPSSDKQPELPLGLPGEQAEPERVAKKHLPEANEFSPTPLERGGGLHGLLVVIDETGPDLAKLKEAIRKRFFESSAPGQTDPAKRKKVQTTLGYNALLGACKYGLVDRETLRLTELGRGILDCDADRERYEILARHIIRNLYGLEVLTAIREMQAAGSKVDKNTLQAYLEQMGFELPRAAGNHLKLLRWLRLSGVLPEKGYEVSEEAVEAIAGISLDTADDWSVLTEEQQAFLRSLRRVAVVEGPEPVPAKQLFDAVEDEHGPIFRRPDQLAATVLNPLAEAGWIARVGIGKSGRGGKSGKVAATEKLLEIEPDVLPSGDGLGIPADLRAHLQTPLKQIYGDLGSSNTHTKGIALELLALRMANDLSLTPVKLRERGASTGGAEVDLIADAAHLHFSRWLIQCKNTKTITVATLAKEVGMAVLLKASVIVIVTTGRIPSTVATYARELALSSSMQAVLVDGKLMMRYREKGPGVLRKHFKDAAEETLAVKLPQVVREVSEG
jgi:hypothetical protein